MIDDFGIHLISAASLSYELGPPQLSPYFDWSTSYKLEEIVSVLRQTEVIRGSPVDGSLA